MSKYKINIGDRIVDASEYQDAIFDNIEHGVGNMIIKAAAGSAKTTTIVNCINIIPKGKTILFIAFNKDIVEAIREKIGVVENAKISTFHSLGLSIVKENIKNFTQNQFKYKNYLKDNIDSLTSYNETSSLKRERQTYINNILNLIEYSRYYVAFTYKEIQEIAEKYGLSLIRDEIEVCQKMLKWGMQNTDEIDFTDMIWLPNILNMTTKKYRFNWILIDEAQDVTIAEQQLVMKCFKRGTRVVVSGDINQMINVWAGSDERAIENFASIGNAKEFRLPISYRCPKKVVELAQAYSDNIIAKDDAIDGEIRRDVSKYAPTGGDMVLCRITAPLIELHLDYLRVNKKSYVVGYDKIREKYLELIEMTDSKFIDRAMQYKDGLISELYGILLKRIDQVMRTYKLDEEDALLYPTILSTYDSIMGIETLSEGLSTVDELKDKINVIFSGTEEDAIRLSSVHKAKGLEADNVFILNESLMPISYAEKDWEILTEKNLIYVAITRAKKTLNYIKEDKKWQNNSNGIETTIAERVAFARQKLGNGTISKKDWKNHMPQQVPALHTSREIGSTAQPRKKTALSKFSAIIT